MSTTPQNDVTGLCVASLTLGILGLVFLLFCYPVSLVLGILAVIFGAIGRKQVSANGASGSAGQAVAGLVMGIITLSLAALMTLAVVLPSLHFLQYLNNV
jgi:hypothetical protein